MFFFLIIAGMKEPSYYCNYLHNYENDLPSDYSIPGGVNVVYV